MPQGVGFPIPPFQWPHVGRQWPPYNVESNQAVGLVAWWPTLASRGANGLRDLVGGKVATFNNTPEWIQHESLGWGVHFTRTDSDWIDTGYTLNASTANPLFVSFWVQFDSSPSWQSVLDAFVAGAQRNLQIWLNDDRRLYVYHNRGTMDAAARATFALTIGTLYHILYTAAAGAATGELYIDGVKDNDITIGAQTPGDGSLVFGRLADGNASSYTDGALWDIRWGQRHVPGSEASQVYDQATRWELYQIPRRLWQLGAIGISVITGTASISGSGALSATGLNEVLATSALSGAGALSAVGLNVVLGTSALSGEGALAAAGLGIVLGTAPLSGQGDISAAAMLIVLGSGALTGEGALAASAVLIISGAAALAGSGALTASGMPIIPGVASLSGAGALTAAGLNIAIGMSVLTGVGSLSGDSLVLVLGALALSGSGALAADGSVISLVSTPAERIYIIDTEGRAWTISAGTRIYLIGSEDRILEA